MSSVVLCLNPSVSEDASIEIVRTFNGRCCIVHIHESTLIFVIDKDLGLMVLVNDNGLGIGSASRLDQIVNSVSRHRSHFDHELEYSKLHIRIGQAIAMS